MGLNTETVIGYATGSVTGSGYDLGGLVGFNLSNGMVSGYATVKMIWDGSFSKVVGGLVGENDGAVTGYWDQTTTEITSTLGGGVGISSITNVEYNNINHHYTDTENSNNVVFDDQTFTYYFTLPEVSSTWPKLSTSIFSLYQPNLP